MVWGSITCALKRFNVQPRPNGPQGSRCAFCKPHLARVSRVHSFACFKFGEAVKRGPITSLRYESVCMTCDRFRPSSRILAIGSFGSSAVCGDCTWSAKLRLQHAREAKTEKGGDV